MVLQFIQTESNRFSSIYCKIVGHFDYNVHVYLWITLKNFTHPHTVSVTTEYLFNSIGLSCSKVATHAWEREKRKILVTPFWKSFLWLFGRNFSEFWDWSQSSALLSIATECNFKSKRTSHKWKKKKKKKYFICMWFRYYVKRFMCRVYCYSCGKQYEWCENGGYTINWFHVMDEHSVSFHWYANRNFFYNYCSAFSHSQSRMLMIKTQVCESWDSHLMCIHSLEKTAEIKIRVHLIFD